MVFLLSHLVRLEKWLKVFVFKIVLYCMHALCIPVNINRVQLRGVQFDPKSNVWLGYMYRFRLG